ncbi:MAG: TonB-dependent receptor plug domain-containing protein [Gemmatimonadota bacterium]|jgi:hypothetical protein
MVGQRSLLPLLPLAILLAACATRPFDRTTVPGGEPLGVTTAGTTVITGDALTGDATLTLLDAIRRAMPQMRIVRGASPGSCPLIDLRGRDRIFGASNPDIYVDGTRTLDTCPLVTMQAISARRIEVYPLGVTPRAGYPSQGHGLILVFLQRAGSAGE